VRFIKHTAFVFIVLIIIGTAIAGSRVSDLSVTSEGRDIKIAWEMLDQTGVRHFDVERRAIDQEKFMRINDRPIALDESRKYEYIDRSVYKIENAVVFYRIAIVEVNGSVYYSDSIPLGKISSVRRTWGSIKSMFR
jgi:hypothetical protein